jgi:hypothetical protein
MPRLTVCRRSGGARDISVIGSSHLVDALPSGGIPRPRPWHLVNLSNR